MSWEVRITTPDDRLWVHYFSCYNQAKAYYDDFMEMFGDDDYILIINPC